MTDFGGKLREARERRGITLRQIANTTKISVAALEALERNDISKLPGGIFSRAFVRSYAFEVGLDPEETVREFLERFQGEPAPTVAVRQPVPEAESSFESQQRMATVLLTLILVSIPIAGGLLYFTLRPRPAADAAPPSVPQVGDTRNDPAGQAPPATSTQAPTVPASRAVALTLEVHPTAPCWVTLTIDGRRVLGRLMHAGERQVHEAREVAVIEVGDAGAFAYTINGQPGKPLGAAGEVKTARITRETVREYVR